MSEIEELLSGSIDMHVHFGPDPYRERRFDAVQLALSAQAAGMGGLVLKCHFYPTASIAYATSQIARDIRLFSSLALNNEVGGLNPEAVEVAARLGSRMIWMPTFSAKNDKGGSKKPGKGLSVFKDDGGLRPEVIEILEIIRQYDMVLGTGHLSLEEIFAVLDAANQAGVKKVVVTHASSHVGTALSVEEQLQAVRRGAFIEHSVLSLMPLGERLDPAVVIESVKAVGPERCILSTDLGQAANPSPPEGMRMFIAAMLQGGLRPAEVELMVKKNPTHLLGEAGGGR